VEIRNYRGATKEGHRGEIINIVALQKKGIAVKSKIPCCNKRWHRGELINIVALQKMDIVMNS
jgi:hypothetical protein